MNSAIERLLSLRVSDVMSKGVIDVSPQATMQQAAGSLASQELSAAPVVDEQGRCVGMLSATDFLLARCGVESVSRINGDQSYAEKVSEEKVDSHMSQTLQTVAGDDTLIEAARRMCGVHVHRMPVLDPHGRVLGMISSLDIAAAMVKAIEE